jgi:hypothetical protein
MAWFSGHSENVVRSVTRFTFMPFCGLDSSMFDKNRRKIFSEIATYLEVNGQPVALRPAFELKFHSVVQPIRVNEVIHCNCWRCNLIIPTEQVNSASCIRLVF